MKSNIGKYMEWLKSHDTGLSSLTIFCVMLGMSTDLEGGYYDLPRDPSDFGRCYRLIERFPEFKADMYILRHISLEWKNFVDNYDVLVDLYINFDDTDKMYKVMKNLGF